MYVTQQHYNNDHYYTCVLADIFAHLVIFGINKTGTLRLKKKEKNKRERHINQGFFSRAYRDNGGNQEIRQRKENTQGNDHQMSEE